MVIAHLECGHAVRLGTWLPILQGIAIKAFRDIRHFSVDRVFQLADNYSLEMRSLCWVWAQDSSRSLS